MNAATGLSQRQPAALLATSQERGSMATIGLIGPSSPDMGQDNIGDSLSRSGHRVVHLGQVTIELRSRLATRAVELASAARPGLEDRIQRRILRAAQEHGCEAVINLEGTLSPSVVEGFRESKIPIALWFPDAVSNMGRQRMLAAPYSAFFFKEPVLVKRLRDTLNLPVWYLPQACSSQWHRPLCKAGTERHIAVVGNTYLSRLILLERLHKAGIPIRIYGSAFPRWASTSLPKELHAGHSVHREAKSQVFRSAAGVLNNLHPAEIHGVNRRLFEATGAGGAVLCEDRPALRDLFDVDSEVVSFVTFDELVNRAMDLLDRPELTASIGDAASKRAHADHTYERRLPTILEKLL